MGYTTEFAGRVDITPPLNPFEIAYLNKFSQTRRMHRTAGPYFVDGNGSHGQDHDADVIDYNWADPAQPGLWCQWVPTQDGTALVWDEGEKFYRADAWMEYIIDHFLKPSAAAQRHFALTGDPQFAAFTFDHVCNGTIDAQGEDSGDRWQLVVTDNAVTIL